MSSLGERDAMANAEPLTRESAVALIQRNFCEVGLPSVPQQAYGLGTAEHETGGTMQPVREAFFLGPKAERYRWRLPYYPYYGRGFVQLTWQENYEKFGALLGLDLVKHPDLVMEPEKAAWIMAYGFKHGLFTGKRLEECVSGRRMDFINARRCINGLDCAEKIALLARRWMTRLQAHE